jgi:putative DNA primase/helicase
MASTKPIVISEHEAAMRFAIAHGEALIHDHHRGRWYSWDGITWRVNENGLAFDLMREICRDGGIKRSGAISGALNIAKNLRRFAVTSEIWDQDPWLLGTPAGTVDLRDGSLRTSDQGDHITKRTSVAPAKPGTEPTRWLEFLNQAMRGDQAMIRYLQKCAGYSLTGLTIEHSLFFNHGPGGNGKSVFSNTMLHIMGEYATVLPMDALMASQGQQHPTTLAALRGARLACASETEEGRAWAEAKIKEITGGTPIKARFMRQDEFEYTPQFKLWIIGNHKPVLKNVDDAVRRRFKLMSWLFKPEIINKMLEQDLMREWSAILRWAIDGCHMWQCEGLCEPEAVQSETASYFADQDSMAQWMGECCDVEDEAVPASVALRCGSSKLYGSWAKWCERNGEQPLSGKSFAMSLQRRGFEKKHGRSGSEFLRITVRQSAGASGDLG